MSYLARPRIGFISSDAMTNPSTANNENVIHLLDYDKVEVLNPPQVVNPPSRVNPPPRVGPAHAQRDLAQLPALDDAAYREWMTTQITYSDPLDQIPDRTQPDWQFGMPGYWNYYGDHLTTFGSAQVNGVWLEDGSTAPTTADALVGARVAFDAKLVDLDPADTFTSQLISISFRVFGADASGQPAELLSGLPTTSRTRWLNFGRPGGAGTFQSVIPNEALTFVEESRAPRSPALEALRQGAASGAGLLLRYCLYMMAARRDQVEMYDRFSEGELAVNPKFGYVLGSIGVWNGRDMVSVPIGRILQQPGSPFFPPAQGQPGAAAAAQVPGSAARRVKSHEDVDRVTRAAAADADGDAWAARVWPAASVVDGDRITLDLLTTFPEVGGPHHSVDKHDVGPVTLTLDTPTGPIEIGPVAYDRATYESQAGVVELTVPPEAAPHLADSDLVLMAGSRALLHEIDIMQVETDDLAVYMDLAPVDGALRATADIELRAFRRGEPISEPETIGLQYFVDEMIPGQLNSLNPLVVTACEVVDRPIGTVEEIEIPAGGRQTLTLVTDRPGCFKVRFLPKPMQPGADPNFAVEFFTCYRALPHDDYSHVSDKDLTWSYLHENVVQYYAIMYPVMSRIIPWGPTSTPTDPDRVVQFASLMREAVDESRIGTALQMPITRELSQGKRELIKRWCDLQLRGAASPPRGA